VIAELRNCGIAESNKQRNDALIPQFRSSAIRVTRITAAPLPGFTRAAPSA